MAERKFSALEMHPKMAQQNVASSQMSTSSSQGASIPLSTIQHGSVVPVHKISGRDDHSSYHRVLSPSRTQEQGGAVQRPVQPQQQPRWVVQGVPQQPRLHAPLPKPAPQQQVIRELGPVGKHGGERIVLQRHVTAAPNPKSTGVLRQQLFHKISHYSEPQSHENMFKQYKQGPVSTMASSIQELVEQQSKMVETGRQSANSEDIPVAHIGDRFSPVHQQVHVSNYV